MRFGFFGAGVGGMVARQAGDIAAFAEELGYGSLLARSAAGQTETHRLQRLGRIRGQRTPFVRGRHAGRAPIGGVGVAVQQPLLSRRSVASVMVVACSRSSSLVG
jgi:hypothetical protein